MEASNLGSLFTRYFFKAHYYFIVRCTMIPHVAASTLSRVMRFA